jgi:hypothetical protein
MATQINWDAIPTMVHMQLNPEPGQDTDLDPGEYVTTDPDGQRVTFRVRRDGTVQVVKGKQTNRAKRRALYEAIQHLHDELARAGYQRKETVLGFQLKASEQKLVRKEQQRGKTVLGLKVRY